MNAYPILYSFRRCPYAMRARLALHYAGIQCEVREVSLQHKSQALLNISAKATVPVLQLPDGRVMDESLDIMLWALAENDSEQWLKPANGPVDDMIALIRLNDNAFKFHLDRYKYPQRFGAESGVDHFRQASAFLSGLEQRLRQSICLFGDTVSFADVALFPFVRQFAAVDRQAFEALAFVHLQQWLLGWVSNHRFLATMVKRQVWQAHDPAVFLLS